MTWVPPGGGGGGLEPQDAGCDRFMQSWGCLIYEGVRVQPTPENMGRVQERSAFVHFMD